MLPFYLLFCIVNYDHYTCKQANISIGVKSSFRIEYIFFLLF